MTVTWVLVLPRKRFLVKCDSSAYTAAHWVGRETGMMQPHKQSIMIIRTLSSVCTKALMHNLVQTLTNKLNMPWKLTPVIKSFMCTLWIIIQYKMSDVCLFIVFVEIFYYMFACTIGLLSKFKVLFIHLFAYYHRKAVLTYILKTVIFILTILLPIFFFIF